MAKKQSTTTMAVLAAALALGAGASQAAVVTWTGGDIPTSTSWNALANWDGVALPNDEALFTNAGLATGRVITLDANQSINTLSVGATTGFIIGSTADTYTLTLTNVNRADIAGTESIQTIAANVVLGNNSTWDVAGSNYLEVTGAISGAYSLTKQGAGELRLSSANSYSGDTIISAGTLRVTSSGVVSINGNLTIGDGSVAAAYTSRGYGGGAAKAIADTATVTINNKGTFDAGWGETVKDMIINAGGYATSDQYFGVTNTLYINGGTCSFGYYGAYGNIAMTGGVISGGLYKGSKTNFTTNASSSTATVASGATLYYASNNSTVTVADGSAIIDLLINGKLDAGDSTKTMTKQGAGVMKLTNAGNVVAHKWIIAAGTLLVDNASGAGTGKSLVTVNGGGTLGGAGFIGGVATYTGANVNLLGTNASTLATLAPGTMNVDDGSHVVGTLSVGSALQSNTVNFGNYSQLVSVIGSGASDKLAVTGTLTLGAGANGPKLVLVDNAGNNSNGSAGAGAYQLATASVLTGTFASVTNPFSGSLHEKVAYTSTSVDLSLYNVAAPNTLGNVTFGDALVGSSTAHNLAVNNTAAAGAYSELLNAAAPGSVNGITFTTSALSGIAGGGSGNLVLSLDTATAGAKGGSAVITFQSDANGANGYGLTTLVSQTITLAGNVYNSASLTTNTASTLDHGGTLSIANAAGFYSLAQVSAIAPTNGWTLSGLSVNDTIVAGATNTSGSVIAPSAAGLLNGTVQAGILTITFQNNQSLLGAASGDLGTRTWSLSRTVSGNVASIGSAQTAAVGAGQSLAGFNAVTGRDLGNNVLGTQATLLSGTAAASGTASMTFRSRTGGEVASVFSDVVDLNSVTGTDPFVLQLSYNPADLGSTPETSLFLGWNNGTAFINAGNTATYTSPFLGAWTDAGSPMTAGMWGVDAANNTVWAVIDHNSEFAVVVPEPAMLALLALGSLAVLRRRRGL